MLRKIAHRGASGRFPENTQLAFEKAIDAGVDMIEIDCQLSSDGHVVVFHDEGLRRTARVAGEVKRKSLAELKQLDIGHWRKQAHRGQRILTLEEVLEAIGERVSLCLDIKQFPQMPQGIELKLLFTLSHYDCLDCAVLSSFDYSCLSRIRELAPEARLGVTIGRRMTDDAFSAAERLDAACMLIEKEVATRQVLERAWDDGRDVYIWTVNELREMEKFAAMGVQGLISDFPERFERLQHG